MCSDQKKIVIKKNVVEKFFVMKKNCNEKKCVPSSVVNYTDDWIMNQYRINCLKINNILQKLFNFLTLLKKNPAYGRHQLSPRVRIVAPIL